MLSHKQLLQINQALFSITNAYQKRMNDEKTKNQYNLSLADCAVLVVMYQFAPLNSRTLAKIMDLNPGTISLYVQRLIQKRFIEKIQDRDDRRNWWLSLSSTGTKVTKGIVNEAVHYTDDFLSCLTIEEKSVLHTLILKISHSLGYTWQ